MSLANHYNYVVKVIENDRLQAENESLREYLERDTALVAQQAAVIEQMREALNTVRDQNATVEIRKAAALQPCPEVLNKVRADAVRRYARMMDEHASAVTSKNSLPIAEDYAQRIERGEA